MPNRELEQMLAEQAQQEPEASQPEEVEVFAFVDESKNTILSPTTPRNPMNPDEKYEIAVPSQEIIDAVALHQLLRSLGEADKLKLLIGLPLLWNKVDQPGEVLGSSSSLRDREASNN